MCVVGTIARRVESPPSAADALFGLRHVGLRTFRCQIQTREFILGVVAPYITPNLQHVSLAIGIDSEAGFGQEIAFSPTLSLATPQNAIVGGLQTGPGAGQAGPVFQLRFPCGSPGRPAQVECAFAKGMEKSRTVEITRACARFRTGRLHVCHGGKLQQAVHHLADLPSVLLWECREDPCLDAVQCPRNVDCPSLQKSIAPTQAEQQLLPLLVKLFHLGKFLLFIILKRRKTHRLCTLLVPPGEVRLCVQGVVNPRILDLQAHQREHHVLPRLEILVVLFRFRHPNQQPDERQRIDEPLQRPWIRPHRFQRVVRQCLAQCLVLRLIHAQISNFHKRIHKELINRVGSHRHHEWQLDDFVEE